MTIAATSNTPWPTVKLGDVCEEIRERISTDVISVEHYITTDNMLKSCGGVKLAESLPPNTSLVHYRQGDVLLSNIRPYLKKLWCATFDGGCSSDVIVFRSKREDLSSDYLYQVLSQEDFFSYVMQNVSGTKMPRGKRDWIKEFAFPLPPLEVQREIVAKVEKGLAEADGLAAHFKRLAALADETFKAELDETFQSLSAPTVKLGDVCEFRRGLTYKKTDEVLYSLTRVLRSNNVDLDSGELDLTDVKCLRDDLKVTKEKFVFKDTILMCMANGSKAHLGKVAFIEKDERFAFGGFMGLLVPNKIYPKYAYFSLRAPSFKELINSLQDGANINNLKFSDISDYFIPLPSLEEQQVIVAKLEAVKAKCEQLKVEAERGVKAAEALRKAVLAEAFEQ